MPSPELKRAPRRRKPKAAPRATAPEGRTRGKAKKGRGETSKRLSTRRLTTLLEAPGRHAPVETLLAASRQVPRLIVEHQPGNARASRQEPQPLAPLPPPYAPVTPGPWQLIEDVVLVLVGLVRFSIQGPRPAPRSPTPPFLPGR